MGLGYVNLIFEAGIPSLRVIQEAFFKQTGLQILLIAELNISLLTTDAEQIWSLVKQDEAHVRQLKQEFNSIIETGRYEEAACYRDTYYKPEINKLNHITAKLLIPEFYDIEFTVKNNTLEITRFAEQYYGIVSLVKILFDLGGRYLDLDNKPTANGMKDWLELRKWQDYNRFNRPRK